MATIALEFLSAAGREEACWELFHENSKLGRVPVRPGRVAERAGDGPPPAFAGCPAFALAAPQPVELPLGAAMALSRAAGLMRPGRIWRDTLSALLLPQEPAAGNGIGIWFHAVSIDGMPTGLYCLDRERSRAMLVRAADLTAKIASALPEPELAAHAALHFFIVADLATLAARHGERGYRYALVEAGRAARDIALVAAALDLVAITTAEFRDREVDALLGLDGRRTAALLMIAIGKTGAGAEQRKPAIVGGQRGRRRRRRGRR